jgi:hypothetical protein
MARPQKEGLDYFPLDVDIDQDDKVALIEAQHGVTGFAVVIKLLMKIYKNSYFYQWTEKEQLLFSRVVNVDINKINAIINDCLKWGLFSQKIYDAEQILTSKGIQLRYLEATSRRQVVKIPPNHLLICKSKVNDYKNLVIEHINENINEVNVNINPQSKVKESKEKKDYTTEIKNFLTRYSDIEGFNELNKRYWNAVRETRKSGKIQQSVIYNNMTLWDSYDPVVVQHALTTYLDITPRMTEKYTIGIMRNTSAEEARTRLNKKMVPMKKSNINLDWEAL